MTKKILITGGNGYIGSSLYNALKENYDVTKVTRQDFDLTAVQATIDFFDGKYFDVVFHCAIAGGSRVKEDSWKAMDVNLCMYYNLLQCKPHYGRLVNFGSGAEMYDGEKPYGLSKKVITNSVSYLPNFYNVRVFGLFDENELETRFIKSCVNNYINRQPMVIHKDKKMTFFYMKDLIILAEYYVNSESYLLFKDVNCSYGNNYYLSEIARMINKMDSYSVPIKIESSGLAEDYVSYFNCPYNLDKELVNFDKGLLETYNKIKRNKQNVSQIIKTYNL